MKIAMPVSDGQLCSHFGHCEKFYIYDVHHDSSEIMRVAALDAPPHEPGLLPRLLGEEGVNVVIAGGMGTKAQEMFSQKGIQVVAGVSPASGSPEELVKLYLSGGLKSGPNICDH